MEDRSALEAFVRGRVGPAVTDLGWVPRSGESELTKQLRGELIGAQGKLGNDPAVQRRAAELYRAYCDDATAVDPNVVPSLVAILAYTGDATRYDEFNERFAPPPHRKKNGAISSRSRHSSLTHYLNAHSPAPSAETFVHKTRRFSSAPSWGMSMAENWPGVCENELGEDGSSVPQQGLRRMCGGIVNLATPELERTRASLSQRARSISAGKRWLRSEHLRIAVTVRERDSRALRAYLDRYRKSL